MVKNLPGLRPGPRRNDPSLDEHPRRSGRDPGRTGALRKIHGRYGHGTDAYPRENCIAPEGCLLQDAGLCANGANSDRKISVSGTAYRVHDEHEASVFVRTSAESDTKSYVTRYSVGQSAAEKTRALLIPGGPVASPPHRGFSPSAVPACSSVAR